MERISSEEMRAKRVAATEATLAALTLTELVGSAEEVESATKIRATKVKNVANVLASTVIHFHEPTFAKFLEGVLAHVAGISDATWWIGIRNEYLESSYFWMLQRQYPLPK
jgi:hypothetical protein